MRSSCNQSFTMTMERYIEFLDQREITRKLWPSDLALRSELITFFRSCCRYQFSLKRVKKRFGGKNTVRRYEC